MDNDSETQENFYDEDNDYDTDFTFCWDDEDYPDESGDKNSSYQNSATESDFESLKCEEKLASLSESKRKAKRKAKTIFSMDFGDLSALLLKKTERDPQPSKQFTSDNADVPGEYGDGFDFREASRKKKKSCYFSEDASQCKVLLPYKSTSNLILTQTQQQLTAGPSSSSGFPAPPQPFTATFHLENPTDSPKGFKIYCDSTTWFNFSVRPRSGAIPSNSRISVEIKTKMDPGSEKPPTNLMVAGNRFWVKVFPGYFSEEIRQDKDKLSDFLNLLRDQSPHLIHSISIPRILLWDGSDLSPMMTALSSCASSLETESLKAELHRRYATHVRPEVKQNSKYRASEILAYSGIQRMRRALRNIKVFHAVQYTAMFLALTTFTVIYILPLLVHNV